MKTGIDCKGREWEEIPRGRARDLTNETFNYLTGLFRINPPNAKDSTWWLFKCKCGNEFMSRSREVIEGHTNSCGCYKNE